MPTEKQVERALKLMTSGSAAYEYFFSKLDDPEWVKPLWKRGVLSDPPNVSLDDEGRIIGAAWWPPSKFLIRMADRVPDDIITIMLGINTDNYFVISDLTEAAHKMPVEMAARWAAHMIDWLRAENETNDLLIEDLAELVAKLAKEGEPDSAVGLLTELLAVFPDPELEQNNLKGTSEGIVFHSLPPKSRCDEYSYKRVLEIVMPALLAAVPCKLLQLFSELMVKTIRYSVVNPEDDKPHDYLRISRPSIADHDQNHGGSYINSLITALRSVAEQICDSSPDKLKWLVETLEQREWDFFHRMSLYLLQYAHPESMALIEPRLVNKESLNSKEILYEYYCLMKERYGNLSCEGQRDILSWIADAQYIKEHIGKNNKSETDDVKRRWERHWQYNKLLPLAEHLTGESRDWYGELKSEFGEPDMPPGFSSWCGSVPVEQGSPKTAEELAALSPQELISFLKEWMPEDNWVSPTPRGLGVNVECLIKDNPELFFDNINLFMDVELEPTYISAFIRALTSVMEEGKVEYDPVFEFCQWVVDLPLEISGRAMPESLDGGFDYDSDRRAARSEIASFVEKMVSDKLHVPFEYRERIWSLIAPLTSDADPTSEYESKYKGDLTTSINTVRGKALHAVMHYALWVCRNIQERVKNEEDRKPGLVDMPEVREVLELHLDYTFPQGQSTTDHAVYGNWLPQLVAVDRPWVENYLDYIFPAAKELRQLRWAAWETYLLYSRKLYRHIAMMLMEIYQQEVAALEGKDIPENTDTKAENRLVEHLTYLYGWGDIGVEEGGLIERLFDVASPVLTGHAMKFIGRQMSGSDDIPQEVLERLKILWEWRVRQCCGTRHMPDKELGAFVLWFASRRFEPTWSFGYLQDALKYSTIEPFYFTGVFEYIATLFDDYPLEVLRCVRLFIETRRDPFFHLRTGKKQAIRQILECGLKGQDENIRMEAAKIVHLLGSQGFLEYRDLIQKQCSG